MLQTPSLTQSSLLIGHLRLSFRAQSDTLHLVDLAKTILRCRENLYRCREERYSLCLSNRARVTSLPSPSHRLHTFSTGFNHQQNPNKFAKRTSSKASFEHKKKIHFFNQLIAGQRISMQRLLGHFLRSLRLDNSSDTFEGIILEQQESEISLIFTPKYLIHALSLNVLSKPSTLPS